MKGYKILTNEMTSPLDSTISWKIGEVTKLGNNNSLKIASNGLHLYGSLDEVSVDVFGSRIFLAETIGETIKDSDNIICSKEIKLLKELAPSEVRDSKWAFHYCENVKDDPKVAKNITDSYTAYHYCKDIKDRPEVRKNITDSYYAYYYCKGIEDRPEVRKHITDSFWAYQYCLDIEDHPEVRNNITDSQIARWYCKNIENRPEVRKYIKN